MKKNPCSLIPAVIRQDLELIWGGEKHLIGGLGTQWAPHPTANGAGENLEVRRQKDPGEERRQEREEDIFDFLPPTLFCPSITGASSASQSL